MRISDWSSDVCSSDLLDSEEPDNQSWFVDVRVLMASDAPQAPRPESNYFADYDALVTKNRADIRADMLAAIQDGPGRDHVQPLDPAALVVTIGSASGRDSVCQYVYISVVAVSLTKKLNSKAESLHR